MSKKDQLRPIGPDVSAARPANDTGEVSADAERAESGDNDNVVALEAPRAPLTPAAKRALAEAEARRAAREAEAKARAKEIGGRGGPDPVRYGDWEQGGICWDF